MTINYRKPSKFTTDDIYLGERIPFHRMPVRQHYKLSLVILQRLYTGGDVVVGHLQRFGDHLRVEPQVLNDVLVCGNVDFLAVL